MPLSLQDHADGRKRCSWCGELPDYMQYHDTEWGWPVADDRRLFEKMVLEGFQSGLSWLTILRKREAFREAFAGFDFTTLARFGAKDVERLLGDARIVRHRGKIESAINNARQVCTLLESRDSLAGYVWQFEAPKSSRPKRLTPEVATTLTESAESRALSKDLKKRGFSFVGPTTMYAFMQSMGIVNDHLHGCHVREDVELAREAFVRPGR
jgi:DNA-3-methyladenine glycosylase I